ncbi:MAG: enoyl-CoA hydratase [Chloroflexi bacterium]|jgi:enoyl-CoA hydratase/carnithine racemase|nr:enoyl-CoA hydratase [Chloroflexota bacterium]MCH2304211.1 enoyl-CoA hydratase-related protein [SAR202 cluster bacterium]
MSYKFINYVKKNKIAYITINRPERMNALHAPANEEMTDAFNDFNKDPDTWIAILTGKGPKSFSAGNDLKYTNEQNQSSEKFSNYNSNRFGGIDGIWECWKPIIGAINGYALGGGLELAMSCDILIAADHSELGLPEGKVGLVPGSGVHRLPRHIPIKIAMGMILTGRRISAEEALNLGLVNEVVPIEDLMDTAERWANEILQIAPLSARASKQMILSGLDSPLNIAMTRKYSEWEKAQSSKDIIEGPKAFSEKRQPNWTGF